MAELHINLPTENCFHEENKLEALNRLIRIQTTLSPGQISTSVSCSFQDALQLLLVLYAYDILSAYLVVYDHNHPEQSILRRPLNRGYPSIPFRYEVDDDERTITNFNDFLFTFEFEVTQRVQIYVVSSSNDSE